MLIGGVRKSCDGCGSAILALNLKIEAGHRVSVVGYEAQAVVLAVHTAEVNRIVGHGMAHIRCGVRVCERQQTFPVHIRCVHLRTIAKDFVQELRTCCQTFAMAEVCMRKEDIRFESDETRRHDVSVEEVEGHWI